MNTKKREGIERIFQEYRRWLYADEDKSLGEFLWDAGIRGKEGFEITQTRINYVYRNEIKAKVYEGE